MESQKTILFITYTMKAPIVGGAFMRALRLALEMSRRGWRPIICNSGPILQDPKVTLAKRYVRFIRLIRDRPGLTMKDVVSELSALKPDVVVMGEGPMKTMQIFYDAARRLNRPFIVLDQFYNDWLLPKRAGVDLILLYALASFWGNDLQLAPPYEITPPFIEDVTAKPDLPVPPHLGNLPWVTLVAYDDYVLGKGLELLSRVGRTDLLKVVISSNPLLCHQQAEALGLDMQKFINLPLQMDAVVFGFFAASSIALVSNGFLQIMECLAMACPVIALERGTGLGMGRMNINKRFFSYVSFGETLPTQLGRMEAWFRSDVFSPEMRLRLTAERHGILHCANRIEAVYYRYLWRRSRPRHWRRALLRVLQLIWR